MTNAPHVPAELAPGLQLVASVFEQLHPGGCERDEFPEGESQGRWRQHQLERVLPQRRAAPPG